MTWGTGNWPGSGTELDPYQAPSADALDEVRNFMGAGVYFKQTAHIDLADYQADAGWVPFGFTGQEYDANGYRISGLRINRDAINQSLFGIAFGKIKDLKIYDAAVNCGAGTNGALLVSRAGSLGTVTLERCYIGDVRTVGGSVTGTGSELGGLYGSQANGVIPVDCFVNATVYAGTNYSGILSGRNYAFDTLRCITMGSAEVGSFHASGLSSYDNVAGTITDCATYSSVETNNNLIAGGMADFRGTTVANRVFVQATLTGGTTLKGAVIGRDGAGNTVADCFFNEDYYATSAKGTGLTEAECKDSANLTNFNFTTTWMMLTKTDIEAVCGAGYGNSVYDALPANLKDKPWLRALADVLIEGISPINDSFSPLFFGVGL